jgi:hypothetical protein
MNLAVGVATGAVMAFCGVGDPLLWGTVAFLLKYIPILGPMIGVVVFLLVGLLTIETLWLAFLPAGLYLIIHLAEGETVTPMLLARRFTINPVLVILELVFRYWMWGVPGAILATPMLAITKIICDRIRWPPLVILWKGRRVSRWRPLRSERRPSGGLRTVRPTASCPGNACFWERVKDSSPADLHAYLSSIWWVLYCGPICDSRTAI